MGNFSRNTFDALKQYVGVRLQQGVPIVDADWNEMEDIRKYELEAFLKWFVGDGAPTGSQAFRVLRSDSDNDFVLEGVVTPGATAGRFIVEGWDVINPEALRYTDQRLFKEPDLAVKWGVPELPALTTPTADNRWDLVYLDVWEREVSAQEDRNLINDIIGIETCVRRKREWVVRVAEGVDTWTRHEGHRYCLLAQLRRKAKNPAIEEIIERHPTVPTLSTIDYRLRRIEKILLSPSFNPNSPFDPRGGPVGTGVALLGKNFNFDGLSVRFGDVPAPLVQPPTESGIVTRVPAGVHGNVYITVTTEFGSATSSEPFAINSPPPSFASPGQQFNPKSEIPGNEVTLFGNHFDVQPLKVTFGNATFRELPATVKSSTSSSIVVLAPDANTEILGLRITVTTAGGSVSSDDTFDLLGTTG